MVQISKNLYKNAIIAVILCTNSRAFLYSSLFCTLQRQQNTTLVFTCPAVQSIKDDQTFTNHMLRLFSPVSKNVKKKTRKWPEFSNLHTYIYFSFNRLSRAINRKSTPMSMTMTMQRTKLLIS